MSNKKRRVRDIIVQLPTRDEIENWEERDKDWCFYLDTGAIDIEEED